MCDSVIHADAALISDHGRVFNSSLRLISDHGRVFNSSLQQSLAKFFVRKQFYSLANVFMD